MDPNAIATGADIRIEVAGNTPFDGIIRNFYYDLNRRLPLTTEYLGELINLEKHGINPNCFQKTTNTETQKLLNLKITTIINLDHSTFLMASMMTLDTKTIGQLRLAGNIPGFK